MSYDGDVIFDIVEFMLQPFHTGGMSLETGDDFVEGRYIRITVKNLPNDVFKMRLDPLLMKLYREELVEAVGTQAGRYFSQLREPTPDNIQLGEN